MTVCAEDLTVTLTDAPAAADIAALHRGLEAFNTRVSPPYDRRDLCLFARRPDGSIAAGLTGWTQWSWLYVDYLWLDEALRGGGLGGDLLARAEAEAVARGCRWARLYTYDFQAPSFYERKGYTQWGVLEDFPPGHRQIWFRKQLVPAD